MIKAGGDKRKLVFTMLVGILLLEFGSLTKLKKVWALAFTASGISEDSGSQSANTPTTSAPVQVQPTTHPVVLL